MLSPVGLFNRITKYKLNKSTSQDYNNISVHLTPSIYPRSYWNYNVCLGCNIIDPIMSSYNGSLHCYRTECINV